MASVDFGSEISGMVSQLEGRNPDLAALAHVQKAWKEIAAKHPSLPNHTNALYVVPGSAGSDVIVYVDSQIYATELSLQAEVLRLELNVALNRSKEEEGEPPSIEELEKVKRLRVKLSNEKYTRIKRFTSDDIASADEEPERVWLTEQEHVGLKRTAEQLESQQLRAAVVEALEGYKER